MLGIDPRSPDAMIDPPHETGRPTTAEQIAAQLANIREQQERRQMAERQRVQANAEGWKLRKGHSADLVRRADVAVDRKRRLDLLRRVADMDPGQSQSYESALHRLSAPQGSDLTSRPRSEQGSASCSIDELALLVQTLSARIWSPPLAPSVGT